VTNPGPSSPEIGARLASVRQRDTEPEIALRRALHARGLRYRLHVPLLSKPRRTADIVFPSKRIAVFVDGCFWHGCPQHGTRSKSNAAFWQSKVETNEACDADTVRRLEEKNWTAIRVWEHEDPEEAAERISLVFNGAVTKGNSNE
jgi:DNA mismatch endonuclease, patch repair protein